MNGIRRVIVVCGTILALSLVMAADTSKSIGFATYKERVDRVTVVVGSQVTMVAEHESIIPVQVAVAVWDKGPELEVEAARFTLIDTEENYLQAVPPETIGKEQVGLYRWTAQFTDQNPMQLGSDFEVSHPVHSNLYNSEGVKGDTVFLDYDSHLTDFVFFPRPETGLDGILTLQFITNDMHQPVQVKFEVPKEGHHKKAKSESD